MRSFWSLSTLDKCAALAGLVQALSKARLTSLQMLAEARGEPVETVWHRCCREARVEPCSVPYHLFGWPDEQAPTAEIDFGVISHDTPGYAARTKVLADLLRLKPFETRHLQAHADRQ
jgi:hypothetical protein